MKLNKKRKLWYLSTILATTISISVPLTVGLISNNTKQNRNQNLVQENMDDFVERMKNLDIPLESSTNKNQYKKIKLVTDNWENIIKTANLNTIDSKNISANWLKNADMQQIEDMLLINFNRASLINMSSNATETLYNKDYITLNVTKYDSNNNVVDFDITIIKAALTIKNQYSNYSSKPIYIKEFLKFKFSFKNIKLIPCENSKIPLITIYKENKNMAITCTYSDYKINYDEYSSMILELLDYAKENNLLDENGNPIVGAHYEELKNNIITEKEEFLENISQINSISSLDWKNIDFVESSNFQNNSVPETSPFKKINDIVLGVDSINISRNSTLIRTSYETPYFGIGKYNEDITNFEFIISATK